MFTARAAVPPGPPSPPRRQCRSLERPRALAEAPASTPPCAAGSDTAISQVTLRSGPGWESPPVSATSPSRSEEAPPAEELELYLLRLQAEDFEACRGERLVHIQVPEGVGPDLKVRVQLRNMVMELEVPEDAQVGDVVACDPPVQPPMSGPVQRELLVGGVLHQRLKWFQLPDGNITCDDGPGGRYRCKLDALRAMRGRCMGAVLPRVMEEELP